MGRRLVAMREELAEAVERVLARGQVLLGPELEQFEDELAEFSGRRHAVGVASGTDALRLALRALGVGPGDEVIVPAFTAVPTVAAVCEAGATPVPVDVEEDTAALDPEAARAALTDRTSAAIVVHIYGRPARLPELGVPVVEDAAHAHGALDPAAGSAAAAYSFYPTKNLGGVGDGGAVITDDAELAASVRLMRRHGAEAGYVHNVVAGNSRMSELEAAALRIGLRELPAGNRRRREIAARYKEVAPGLRWQEGHERHVYHLCVARLEDREAFRERAPFETAVHYPLAISEQPAYRHFARRPCPVAERWAAECVTLPCFPELTDDEVEAVCGGLA